MSHPPPAPLVVAIGGFDPSGGAGVVRDFLTARTFGAAVRLIPTAWTDQSAAGVRAVEPREPLALSASILGALQLQGVEQLGDVSARAPASVPVVVKIGMLPDAASAAAVLEALREFNGPVVLIDRELPKEIGASAVLSDHRGGMRDLSPDRKTHDRATSTPEVTA